MSELVRYLLLFCFWDKVFQHLWRGFMLEMLFVYHEPS